LDTDFGVRGLLINLQIRHDTRRIRGRCGTEGNSDTNSQYERVKAEYQFMKDTAQAYYELLRESQGLNEP